MVQALEFRAAYGHDEYAGITGSDGYTLIGFDLTHSGVLHPVVELRSRGLGFGLHGFTFAQDGVFGQYSMASTMVVEFMGIL